MANQYFEDLFLFDSDVGDSSTWGPSGILSDAPDLDELTSQYLTADSYDEIQQWKQMMDPYNPILQNLMKEETEFGMRSDAIDISLTHLEALESKRSMDYQSPGFEGSGTYLSQQEDIEDAFSSEVESAIAGIQKKAIAGTERIKNEQRKYVDDLWNEWDYFVQTTDLDTVSEPYYHTCEESGQVTCWDGSCRASEEACNEAESDWEDQQDLEDGSVGCYDDNGNPAECHFNDCYYPCCDQQGQEISCWGLDGPNPVVCPDGTVLSQPADMSDCPATDDFDPDDDEQASCYDNYGNTQVGDIQGGLNPCCSAEGAIWDEDCPGCTVGDYIDMDGDDSWVYDFFNFSGACIPTGQCGC